MYLVYQQITGAGGAMAGGGSAGAMAGGAMDTSDELQINYTEINDFINNFMLYFRNRVRDYDDTLNGILIEYFVNSTNFSNQISNFFPKTIINRKTASIRFLMN